MPPTKSPLARRQYHAIPGNLRDHPDDTRTTHRVTWIQTPQGHIELGCEKRIHTLFGSGRRDPQALVQELCRMAERALAVHAGAPEVDYEANIIPDVVKAPAPPVDKPVVGKKAPEVVKVATKPTIVTKPKEREVVAPAKKQPPMEIPDKVLRLANYLDSGDIGHIVPAGQFTSKAEKEAWANFVTVEIVGFGKSQIAGKQSVRCIRQSNRTGGPLLAKDTVPLSMGLGVVEVDKDNVITEWIPVDASNAKFLFGPFNSLFRKKF